MGAKEGSCKRDQRRASYIVHWPVEDIELRTEAVVKTDGEKSVAKKECDLFGVDLLAREHDVATAMEEHRFRPVSFILA